MFKHIAPLHIVHIVIPSLNLLVTPISPCPPRNDSEDTVRSLVSVKGIELNIWCPIKRRQNHDKASDMVSVSSSSAGPALTD